MPGQSRKAKKYTLGKATEAIDLDLPSGNTCLVIRPGVQGLIKHGILDSLDSLTGLVQTDLIDAKDPKKTAQAVVALASRPEDLLAALSLMDKVIAYVVQEPKVELPPEDDSERDPEVVYADEVDNDDKMFIFQFVVGGTRDIESFRAQRSAMLGGISTLQDVPLPAE